MLLQSLVEYYEILTEDEESQIPKPGYGKVKVSFALNLSKEGELLNVIPLKIPGSGKGNKLIPRSMTVPEPVTRTVGFLANFLCDNSSYVLGFDNKGKPERSKKCFDAFKLCNTTILKTLTCDEAMAVVKFLESWNSEEATEVGALKEYLEDIYGGANFVFKLEDKYNFVHENKEIKRAWEHSRSNHTDTTLKTCLVTGEKSPIIRLHPILKGIQGGQAMGNSLISFNARAYESYGNEESQGLNAPVGEYAAFAYGTALNHLLSDRSHRLVLGDTTIVFWANSAKPVCQDIMSMLMEPDDALNIGTEKEKHIRDPFVAEEVKGILMKIKSGKFTKTLNSFGFEEDIKFSILGLSPNAARISIRFFLQDKFGHFLSNMLKHYEDMNIVKQYDSDLDAISVWRLLNETVSPTSKDKVASPLLSGAVFQAVLEGSSYPAALFQAVIIRIRAEKNINYYKASIIKAYLLRCKNNKKYKEVLSVALNEKSENKPYVLGRLFAILEKAQQDANPGINTTIKDRYFTSACATPANVFPVLLKLSSHHIAKAEYGYVSDRRLQDILDILKVEENPFPKQLPLEEQGLFILGYYQQKNALFTKKEETKK